MHFKIFSVHACMSVRHLNDQLKSIHNNITEADYINSKARKDTNYITTYYIYSPIWGTIAQLNVAHPTVPLNYISLNYHVDPGKKKTATKFTLLLCIILSGDVQLNPGPFSEDTETSTAVSFDPLLINSFID